MKLIYLLIGFLLIVLMMLLVANSNRQPRIIVNMPADAKPLSRLTEPGDKVIGSDRAVLWWTVYKASLDNHADCYISKDVADQAVKNVYGEIK